MKNAESIQHFERDPVRFAVQKFLSASFCFTSDGMPLFVLAVRFGIY